MNGEAMSEDASAWESEDGALLREIVEREDRDAFRTLFDRYYPRVFVFVQRRLEDHEVAREVTSDVFLEVWSSAATFRGESKISSWIFGIARFKTLEAIRMRGRLKRSRVISTDDEVISQVPDAHGPGTNQLDARDDLRHVERVMQKLPDDQREALELTVLDGLGVDEVAARQHVSRDTVKTRISRARRSLRRMLRVAEGGL